MKTLYISLAWLIIILLIWFFIFYISIDKTIEYFFNEINILHDDTLKENYVEAKNTMNRIIEKWIETEKSWIYFVDQTEIDEIKTSIQKIDNYITIKNQSLILFEIEEFKMFLRLVRGNESLSLENIF